MQSYFLSLFSPQPYEPATSIQSLVKILEDFLYAQGKIFSIKKGAPFIEEYSEEELTTVLKIIIQTKDRSVLSLCESCRQVLKNNQRNTQLQIFLLNLFETADTYQPLFDEGTLPLIDKIPESIDIEHFVRDWYVDNPDFLEQRLTNIIDASKETSTPTTIALRARDFPYYLELKSCSLEEGKNFYSQIYQTDWSQFPSHLYSFFLERNIEGIEVAIASIPNRKRTNSEDKYLCETLLCKEKKIPLFAVFDGHASKNMINSGSIPSSFLQEILLSELKKNLETLEDMSDFSLEKAFILTCLTLGKRLQQQFASGGSTMVLCLVIDDFLWCINVGDSRACMLGERDPPFLQLSQDANPNHPHFRSFIEKRGGVVSLVDDNPPFYRVYGLAMARSFEASKDSIRDCIVPYPTITKTPLGDFLVIASDGLWDVATSKQVMEYVSTNIKSGKSVGDINRELVTYGSVINGDDTITLVCDLRTHLTHRECHLD